MNQLNRLAVFNSWGEKNNRGANKWVCGYISGAAADGTVFIQHTALRHPPSEICGSVTANKLQSSSVSSWERMNDVPLH